jgi:hypothetical protein
VDGTVTGSSASRGLWNRTLMFLLPTYFCSCFSTNITAAIVVTITLKNVEVFMFGS